MNKLRIAACATLVLLSLPRPVVEASCTAPGPSSAGWDPVDGYVEVQRLLPTEGTTSVGDDWFLPPCSAADRLPARVQIADPTDRVYAVARAGLRRHGLGLDVVEGAMSAFPPRPGWPPGAWLVATEAGDWWVWEDGAMAPSSVNDRRSTRRTRRGARGASAARDCWPAGPGRCA